MAIALAAFIFTGCVDDPCDTIDCGLNGVPTETADGASCECECLNGFDGPNCTEIATGKFIGNWSANDECNEQTIDPYLSEIAPNNNDQTKVMVFNFSGFGTDRSWEASISGDTIKIPPSFFEFESNIGTSTGEMEGMGLINEDNNTINWQYVLNYTNGDVEDCIGVWTK